MAYDISGTKAAWAAQLGTTPKGVHCNISSLQLDKPYIVEKLSISKAEICSFSRIGKKIKNAALLIFLPENLEKFRSNKL